MVALPQAQLRVSPHPSVAVSVVIPALNEAENLPHVLPRIPAWVHEVLLVDGHSTDNTLDVARAILPDIRIIVQKGQGKGAALREGIAAAMGDIVVLMDADGSTDPLEIPAFVGTLLAGADFAKGSRFLQGAGTDDMPLVRRIGNGALVLLGNAICKTRYTDITYGYNAFWRRHTEELALEIDGWPCEIISNMRVARAGLCVTEVASFEYERIAGQAKLATFSAGWTILKAMLREATHRRRRGQGSLPARLRRTPGAPEGYVAVWDTYAVTRQNAGHPYATESAADASIERSWTS